MDALGEKPVGGYGFLKLYYTPYRDDTEALFVVDTKMNNWYDHGTDESGNLWHKPKSRCMKLGDKVLNLRNETVRYDMDVPSTRS